MANVVPAKCGATSAWLLRCPAELHALNPMDTVTHLGEKKVQKT